LGPIAKKRNVEVVETYKMDDILILHGDTIPKNIDKGVKTIIIGHEHPAISLRQGIRSEVYKCFLVGKYKKYQLVAMPSFFMFSEGTDILKEEILSPFLKQRLDNFEVYIVSDKVYDFGKLKNLK
jgi:putative SbcD/Mre11-related phosphoesterase